MKLCLHENREGRKAIGLYRGGTHEVISIRHCPAEDPQADQIKIRLFHPKARVPAKYYDHRGRVFQRGRLKFVTIRCAGRTVDDPAGIIISHTGVDPHEIKSWIMRAGLDHLSVFESRLSPADGNERVGRSISHVSGPTRFSYSIGGQAYGLSPMAFFQANRSLANKLIDAVGKTLGTTPGPTKKVGTHPKAIDILLDLYGGFGAYSFSILDKAHEVFLVDGNRYAIEAAAQLAGKIGAANIKGHAMSCETFLAQTLPDASRNRVTHIIVNPPRQGLSREVLMHLSPEKLPALSSLTYVSCNPTSLARDIAHLQAQGFIPVSIEPFDMFPGTNHVEVVAHLVLSKKVT